MDKSAGGSKKLKPLESRVRTGLERFFLVAGLFVGLGVIAGCGTVALFFDSEREFSFLVVMGMFAAALVLIGIVYLSTSMSRDVRVLRKALLEDARERAARVPTA